MADNTAIEGYEKYLLTGRGEILEKLRWMHRAGSILSGQIAGSQTTFITTIIKIMPDKELFAVDVSSQDSVNRRILRADFVLFRGEYEGISNQFTARSIKEATLENHSVFAIGIPEQMLWVQRRAFYRVPVPVTMPAFCYIRLDGGDELELNLLDISVSGVALWDRLSKVPDEVGEGYLVPDARLALPGVGDIRLGLEVRNKVKYSETHGVRGQRFGCQFQDATRGTETQLQKFLFDLQILHREKNRMIRE